MTNCNVCTSATFVNNFVMPLERSEITVYYRNIFFQFFFQYFISPNPKQVQRIWCLHLPSTVYYKLVWSYASTLRLGQIQDCCNQKAGLGHWPVLLFWELVGLLWSLLAAGLPPGGASCSCCSLALQSQQLLIWTALGLMELVPGRLHLEIYKHAISMQVFSWIWTYAGICEC